MAQDQRLPLNRVSGAGFAPGQVPSWDGRSFKPGSSGGLVGYIELSISYPTIYADGVAVLPTSTTIDSSVGDPAVSLVSVDSVDRVQYGTGVYTVSAYAVLSGAVNPSSTDVYRLRYTDDVVNSPDQAFIHGPGEAQMTFPGVKRRTSAWAVDATSQQLLMYGTGLTTRGYSIVDVYLYIARLSA